MAKKAIRKAMTLMDMIKFQHTIFALPFALTAMLLAADGVPGPVIIGWILAAMVGARTAAMAWNRIADAEIDARNPRTANRHLPAGTVKSGEAWMLVIGGVVLLEIAAYQLNPLCLKLSPIPLTFIFVYPFGKRFTCLTHFILGLALASAPLGAWIAVAGRWDWRIAPLFVAVLLWVAGFDILYALQDLEFDVDEGLHSIPSKLGKTWSLRLAAILHFLLFLLLIAQIPLFGLGFWYMIGLGAVAVLLIYEHSLVSPSDLSKLDAAFFTMNGIISIIVFSGTLLDFVL